MRLHWGAANKLVYCEVRGLAMDQELLKRITVTEGVCGGRPCIRGMRIRVQDILEFLSAGSTFEEILEEYPDLERKDILASLQYAAHQMDHVILKAS
jgi:uncharacterized protein (DUF433 family)